MTVRSAPPIVRNWLELARALGPEFAAGAAEHDAQDAFVDENYAALKNHGVFGAGVPAELGGGGASHGELCAFLRELGRACGSTALALSMHTHLVAALVWRYRDGQATAPLLERVAAEQLVLVSTGASDWLESSGRAEPVEGGFRISARKSFGSGSPAGDLLVTSAACDDGRVLHFPVAMSAPGVSVADNWRTMGMRATGSNDVVLEDVFVPNSAVMLERPRGQWHPFFSLSVTVAMPLVMSAYLGVAEAARDLTVQHAQHGRNDPEVWYLLGELENSLVAAQVAVDSMVSLCADYAFTPDVSTANAVLIRKTLAASAMLATVEKCFEAVGGRAFFRSLPLERLLRDVHGAQFHPLPAKRQHRLSGRVALGLPPV